MPRAQQEALRKLMVAPQVYQEALRNVAVAMPNAQQEAVRKLMAMPKAQQEALRKLVAMPRAYQEAVRNLVELPGMYQEALHGLPRQPIQEPSFPSFLAVPAAEVAPRIPPPDTTRASPQAERLAGHAPPEWGETERRRVTRAIQARRAISLIVLAADIRASATLMKEAIDPYTFASTLEGFTHAARRTIWQGSGVFDKFTGDGFLAYWPFTPSRKDAVLRRVFRAARTLHRAFVETHIPQFRVNSQNFPGGIGLSIGLDEGPTNIVAIADDPTVVGPAVVGAVRMVGVAEPRETLANVRLGEYLQEANEDDRIRNVEVTRITKDTKEYQNQTAYAIAFTDLVLEER